MPIASKSATGIKISSCHGAGFLVAGRENLVTKLLSYFLEELEFLQFNSYRCWFMSSCPHINIICKSGMCMYYLPMIAAANTYERVDQDLKVAEGSHVLQCAPSCRPVGWTSDWAEPV